jgi:cobalamin synthase
MDPPAETPRDPRLKDALAALAAASALAVLLLAALPRSAWWALALLWVLVAARVYQGLAKRRRADARGGERGPAA